MYYAIRHKPTWQLMHMPGVGLVTKDKDEAIRQFNISWDRDEKEVIELTVAVIYPAPERILPVYEPPISRERWDSFIYDSDHGDNYDEDRR